MNFVISSVILLAVILIIIYILSIDNNIDKLKNKFKELFNVAKSKKINYLNSKDNINLLNYIKYQFKSSDNVTIPTKIYYNKTERGYEMSNIEIICYKYNNNEFQEQIYIIDILFVPFEKEHYTSNQSLFGLYGNYMMTIKDTKAVLNEKKLPEIIATQDINSNIVFNETIDNIDTDILNNIPDIIHLSEDNSEIDTTDTAELISHNFK